MAERSRSNDEQRCSQLPPPPPHLVWEGVGSEVVVFDTTSHTTHRLTGDLARAFLGAVAGEPINPADVRILQERGFLKSHSPVSRRTLIGGSAAGLGLGLTSLSLPAAGAASSSAPKSEQTDPPPSPPEAPPQADPEPAPPPPQPSILASSLVAGVWRWSITTSLVVSQTDENNGLPEDGTFIAGQAWELALQGFDGPPVEATVTSLGSGSDSILTLRFTFPVGDGITAPDSSAELTGILTKVTDRTVFSEPFPIPAFSAG